MTSKRKGRQQENQLPQISGTPEVEESPPPADKAEEDTTVEEYLLPLDTDDRVVSRMVFGSWKQLVDFALIHQTRVGGQWRKVVQYDCAHDCVHVHLYRKGQTPYTRKICDLDEIEDGCKIAEEGIFGKWEENRRRYFHG